MDLLHKTISEFDFFEKERFLQFLPFNKNNSPLIELFNLFIGSEKPFSEREIEKRIYLNDGHKSKQTSRRTSMLRHRLSEKLADFLISEQFLEKHPSIDRKTSARIRAIKNLGVFFALHRRYPNSVLAMRYLKNAIHLSLKNEFFPLLLYALYWENTIAGHGNEKELIKREKRLDEYELKWRAMRKAVYYFYLLTATEGKSGKPDMKKINRLNKKAIKELKFYYKETKLPSVLYYLKYILCDDAQNKGNYRKALEHLFDIEILMDECPEVLSVERIGFLNDNIARTYWLMNDFKNALKYIRLAQNNLRKDTVDMVLSYEQEFLALIHSGLYAEAIKISEKMMKVPALNLEKHKYLQDKSRFYIACALFKLGRYKDALKQIREKLSLIQDKHGWAFSLRLLELYLLIELDLKEDIDACLKRFKKFLLYHKFPLSKRNKLILQTIFLLKRCGFSPKGKVLQDIKQNIKQLSSNKENFKWNPQGDEIIRFEFWIKIKFLNSQQNFSS